MKIITPSAEATQPQSVNSVHGIDVLLDSLLTSNFHWMVSDNNFSCLCSARNLHPTLADNDLDAIFHIIGLFCETIAINTLGMMPLARAELPLKQNKHFSRCLHVGRHHIASVTSPRVTKPL